MAPVIVNITYYLKPDTEDKFWEAGKPLLDEMKRDERLQYLNFSKIATEPNAIRLVEVWEGKIEELKADSENRKGMAEFLKVLDEIKSKDYVVEPLIPIEGQEYRKPGLTL
ncbi:hypothetical protein K491DRAFT_715170 [Lophiostoma macrostomum CBS 122681]|uniref:ABM domain-containing protein n=1 Tax=Lophiostoma macrostomum CBS 122681 TaxID=1314788 RepID=A0A6A6T9G3_9PLEO|nr:hypothetical protein K491DRAFT_715170 [Lophiostoma macrostomum CBS 122681]